MTCKWTFCQLILIIIKSERNCLKLVGRQRDIDPAKTTIKSEQEKDNNKENKADPQLD